jgi:hypothetical protein
MHLPTVITISILIIGIILLCLIPVGNEDGTKIVLGSLGGVMVIASAVVLIIMYKYPIDQVETDEKNNSNNTAGSINNPAN